VHVREAELVHPEHVKAALDILQANYDLLVADLPHDFRDTTLAVLDRSAVILMPFSPELASVRSVAAALEVFQALEYSPEQIRLILNWTFPKSALPPAEIEKALKKKIDLTLSYDRDLLIRSINKGEPVTLGEVISPLGVQLEDYAYALTREVAGGLASDTPSDAWRRVTQRSGKPSPSKKA
jgi:pilus assembly protein CpaE